MNENPNIILTPPDGGWGWIICFAYALSNVILIPIMQSFGLVFKQKFADIGMSATDASVIINTNSAFGMMMGLINGTLFKKFGYRKVALVGSALVAGGVISTSFANSFEFFFISYGLVTSLGFGLTMSAFLLALNSYFKKKRGRATGYAMTLTGLGPVVMPLLISVLLDEYGTTGCVLLIGGLALHSIVAALLLQPLRWHMKKEIPDQELMPLGNKDVNELADTIIQNGSSKNGLDRSNNNLNDSILSIDHDVETQSIYGFETPLSRRKISQASIYETGKHRKRAFSRSLSQPEKSVWHSSIHSINSLKSIVEDDKLVENEKEIKKDGENKKEIIKINDIDNETAKKNKSLMKRLVNFFDLDLLKDPIYINLMLGMSLAIYAEINFSLLTPFILTDFNLDTDKVAKIMSIIAASDIVFRFLAPFIADWLRQPPKIMYMCSLVMLISARTALLFVTDFVGMMIVAVCLGVAKGFRTVFMSLLIPSYVPLEKLPSASGMQMVVNGFIIMIGGPLLGVIRDITGSYNKCIIVLNIITLTTLVMWTVEYIYTNIIKRR